MISCPSALVIEYSHKPGTGGLRTQDTTSTSRGPAAWQKVTRVVWVGHLFVDLVVVGGMMPNQRRHRPRVDEPRVARLDGGTDGVVAAADIHVERLLPMLSDDRADLSVSGWE